MAATSDRAAPAQAASIQKSLLRQRHELLIRLERIMEAPMFLLAAVWLVLLVLELVRGLSPGLEKLGYAIWIIFCVDFALKFVLAPAKLRYLSANWLTLIALALPALRVFRIFRAFRLFRLARTARGLQLVRILTSLNRGMKVLGSVLGKRGAGYVSLLTFIVLFAGAAGMHALEKDAPVTRGFENFGSSLWWTAMLLTTMGSETWPQTAEGRLLCLLLAIYAFAIFGYVTAAIASFFVGQDNVPQTRAPASDAPDGPLTQLHRDIEALRRQIGQLQSPASGASGAP